MTEGIDLWGGGGEGHTTLLGAISSWSFHGRSARQFISAHISGADSRSGYGYSRRLYDDPPCVYPEGGFSADYRRWDTSPEPQLRPVDRAGKIGSVVGWF